MIVGIAGKLPDAPAVELQRAAALARTAAEPGTADRVAPYIATTAAFLQPEGLDSFDPAACVDGVHAWVDGRIYNARDLARTHGLSDSCSDSVYGSPSHLLAAAQAQGCLDAVLSEANGEFCAAVLDTRANRLMLCTDRIGLHPLYLGTQSGSHRVATRLRAFLGFTDFTPVIAPETAACFLDLGHLVGDRTWFEGVEALPPATVVRIDLDTGRTTRTRYWTWSAILPLRTGRGGIHPDEAEEELGRLLRQAVARRVLPGEQVSVLLSGGLDSRALLACLTPEACAGTATIGQDGCRDIRYAQHAAETARVPHRIFSLTPDNWWRNRLHALWVCDGMAGIGNLCSSQFARDMRELAAVNLNGFAGDLVAGGGYLRDGFLDTPPSTAFAEREYGRYAAEAPPTPEELRFPHTDPYVLAQRVRRFTVAGLLEAGAATEQRAPFMDHDLLEFLYALPDTMRRHGALYHRALLRMRPDLFDRIPWQKTGFPVSSGSGAIARLKMRAVARATRTFQRLGWTRHPTEFQNVGDWLMRTPGGSTLRALAKVPDALWPQFVTATHRSATGPGTRDAKGDVETLLRTISLEAWLQQVYHARLRDPDVPTAPRI